MERLHFVTERNRTVPSERGLNFISSFSIFFFQSLQGYFELSCILVTVILCFTCLLYHPFSLVIAQKVKYHLKRFSGGPFMTSSLANQMRQRRKSPCPICSQKFPEENEYNSLYEPRDPHARSASALYHREVRFQSQYYLERNRRMCSECTER